MAHDALWPKTEGGRENSNGKLIQPAIASVCLKYSNQIILCVMTSCMLASFLTLLPPYFFFFFNRLSLILVSCKSHSVRGIPLPLMAVSGLAFPN